MYTLKGRYTSAFITVDNLEEQCIAQIHRFINHVAFDQPVAIMPDAHAGKNSCVGFVMPLGSRILPSTVGVDLSCGMLSMNIGKKLNITHEVLDDLIRTHVPMGFNVHESKSRPGNMDKFSFSKQFPWNKVNDTLNKFFYEYNNKFGTSYVVPVIDYRSFVDKFKKYPKMDIKRVGAAVGSLGGGNHFIEVSKSESCGDIWITIHSGSRNFGKVVCEYHENVAKNKLDSKRNVTLRERIENITQNTTDRTQIARLIKEAKKELGLDSDVDLRGMEYLEGEDLKEYLIDMVIAHIYASFNREHMMDIISEILGGVKGGERIESVHNYIDFRDFTIRKGAIRSYVGEKMIIPFNMRDGILLCEGKSNPEWNFSAPHGAGRVMSRSKAKVTIDMDKFRRQMKGIFSTSVCKGTLDEAPDAYKDAALIEEAIEPTATIIDRLLPIHNLKDKNSGFSFKERREAKKKDKERKVERDAKNFKRMKPKYQ